MTQKNIGEYSNDPYLQDQVDLLETLREGQNTVLGELEIPQQIARYALSISPNDSVVREVFDRPIENTYFLWRQDVSCPPDDYQKGFAAQIYKLGMPVDATVASVFLPNIAARINYPDMSQAFIFPKQLNERTVKTVVRMANEIHSHPDLPNLTGLYPHILDSQKAAEMSPEIWSLADETDLIPAPWHPAVFAVPTRTRDL